MNPTRTVIMLALFACMGAAQAKDYHYHAPKVSAYRAPTVHTSRIVPVRGYIKHDGTYVMPSHRTSPNATKLDNWSSRPNVNPFTGKQGTKDPYAPPGSGG